MPVKPLKVYDADQVSVSLAGIPLSGYADGEFLRIEESADAFTSVVGTDGQATRSKTNNRLVTITLLLMQSSDSNDLLSALHQSDLSSPGGAGVGAFLARDRNGNAVYRCGQCWVKKAPNVSFGREAGPREWTLEGVLSERTDGGNFGPAVAT